MTQFTDAQKTSLITTSVQQSKKQYGVATDLLSVGEIEGIVGGLSGVFFNGTSLLNSSIAAEKRARIGSCQVNGNLVTNAGDLFKDVDLSRGDYYIQIFGTELQGTVDTYPNSFDYIEIDGISYYPYSITSSYRTNVLNNRPSKLDDELKNLFRFPQLETDGQDWTAVFTDKLYPNPPNDPIGQPVLVDGIYKITNKISNSSATLDASVNINRNTTNVYCKLSRPINAVSSTDFSEELAYSNSFCVFRPGTLDQPPITEVRGIPSASFVVAPNQELLWHNSCSGVDQNGDATQGGASTYWIDSSTFNFGQYSAEAVDKLKLTIEFSAGLRHNGREGEERNTYAEFQIVFNKGSSDVNTILAIGKNYGGDTFDTSVPSWDAGNINTARNFYEYPSGPRYNRGVIHKKGSTSKFIVEFDVDIRSLNLDRLSSANADSNNAYGWRIGIKRLSPQSLKEYALDDNNFQGTAVLKTAEAIFTDILTYPKSAYVTVGFSAEDFSTPPRRSYLIRGRKIKVPTNYLTREETGSSSALYTRNTITGSDMAVYQDWDGSFRGDLSLNDGQNPNFYSVYCNNPAWVFYDILTNSDFGLGEYISEDDVDIYSLYQIARYCDELVPDGLGGSEPRFTCNVYLQGQTEAYKVLKDLASVFRGMMYWIDGKISAVQDRPKEPVYTFNKGNVKEGSFTYTYSGQRARTNQVNVTWNNPAEQYKNTVLTIDDFDNIAETGKIIPTDVVAFGCTSEAQARRVGLWTLSTNINETELVSFSSSINANFLRPGDIVNVADSNSTQVLYSGRTISGSTANLIEVDRDVTFLSSVTYFLQLLYPEPGVYLDQAEATIGSVTYFRGALINGVLGSVTEENALNLTDDFGNAVITQYSKYSRIESQEIIVSGSSNNQISVNTNFSQAPSTDVIWNITCENEEFAEFTKKYRILAIEEDKDQYTFTASYYFRDKFEELELERKVSQPSYIGNSGATDLVPSPTNLSVALSPGGANSDDGGGTTYDAVISWTPPQEIFTDSVGNTNEVPYRFLSAYELQHTFSTPNTNTGFTSTIVEGGSTSYTYPGASGGKNTVRIRTINDLGVNSSWVYVSRDIFSAGNTSTGILGGVSTGGTLSCATNFSTSTAQVYVQEPNYIYTPPSLNTYVVEGATTNQAAQLLAVSAINPSATTDSNGTANIVIDQPDQWHHISESYYTLKSKIYSRNTNAEVLSLSFYTDFSTSWQTGVIGIVHDSIAMVLDEGSKSLLSIDIETGTTIDTVFLGNDITLGRGYHFCKDDIVFCTFYDVDRYSYLNLFGIAVPVDIGVLSGGTGYTTASVQFIPDTGGTAVVKLSGGAVSSVDVINFPGYQGGGIPNVAIIGDGTGALISANKLDTNFGATFSFEINAIGTIQPYAHYANICDRTITSNTMLHAGESQPRNNVERKNLVDFDPVNEVLWIGYSGNTDTEPYFSGNPFRAPINAFKDKRDIIVRWNYSVGYHGYRATNLPDWDAQNYIIDGQAYYRYTPDDILTQALGSRLTGLSSSGTTLATSWGDTSNLYLAKYKSTYLDQAPTQPDNLLEITGIVTGTPQNLIVTSESSSVTFFWYGEDPQTIHLIDNETWAEVSTITPPGAAFTSIWELDIVEGTEDALLVTTDQASSGNFGRAHVYSWAPNTSNDIYWFYDYSTRNTDPWKTTFFQTDPNVQDIYGNNLAFSYWTEATQSRLTSIAGTVSTTLGSTLVTGSGTSFVSEFVDGDFIRVSTGPAEAQPIDSEYRYVVQVLSNTSLVVETAFLRTRSGANGARNSFRVDLARDAILAKSTRDPDSSTYTYTPYVTTQESADRTIGYDATDFSIEYNASGTSPVFVGADTVSPAGNATDIRIYASSLNFTTPEYEFSIGGTILQAFSTTTFFDWAVPVTKTGNSIKVDIIAREQSIPDIQAATSFTITSSTTSSLVVLGLESTDTTIEYNALGTSPVFVGADTVSPAGNATDIRLTASILSGTISSPEYEFFVDGSVVQAFSSATFYDYTIPTTKTSSSNTFLVEARESGTSVVLSSTAILVSNSTGSGSGGPTINTSSADGSSFSVADTNVFTSVATDLTGHTWTSSGGLTQVTVSFSTRFSGGGQSTCTGIWRIRDTTASQNILEPYFLPSVPSTINNPEWPNDWVEVTSHTFFHTFSAGSTTIELEWNTVDGQANTREVSYTTVEF
jgi:hypothetical protein